MSENKDLDEDYNENVSYKKESNSSFWCFVVFKAIEGAD